jgi:parvulin-like peptidyl-prolyl isomerase
VTEPQATSTAEAAVEATEVAAAWTPTPTPTIDASAPITAADLTMPTPEPQPTLPLLTDVTYEEGLDRLEENLNDIADFSVDEYRALIYARLLTEKVSEAIAEETVTETEEQVHARHILIREIAAPETEGDAAADANADEAETRTLEEAKALADEIYARIQDGEDFVDLAAEYSDDLSNAQDGGDLGWFARGRMVAPFEEAAFALAPGEVSEPVETQFGFHIIEVVEKDENRAKDESTIQQERLQAYRDWVQEQLTSDAIQRTEDLTNKLPDDVATGDIFNLAPPQAP